MSEPLLNVMKIMLLAGLYLFFVRVLWSVLNELRDPRTATRRRNRRSDNSADSMAATVRRTTPAVQPPSTFTAAPPVPAHTAGGPAFVGGGVATAPPSVVGQLTVIEPPTLAGVRYALGNEITLGRAATNGIPLDDTYVSTVHARIFCTNGTYFIEDLASRNGSILNGQQLLATTALVPGDRLQVGATSMEFS